jgi:hypothetical protein
MQIPLHLSGMTHNPLWIGTRKFNIDDYFAVLFFVALNYLQQLTDKDFCGSPTERYVCSLFYYSHVSWPGSERFVTSVNLT